MPPPYAPDVHPSHPAAILIPKLRIHFAEFLNEGFPAHLRILSPPTCVGFGTGAPFLTRSFSRQLGSLEFDFTEVSSIYQLSVLRKTDFPILQPTTFDVHIHSHAQATFCVTPLLKRFEAVQEY